MTWSDGTPTIICEICGHTNQPEETVWFQGEVAICKDETACKRRESINNILDHPDPRLDTARQLVLDHYSHNFLNKDERMHISEVIVVSFSNVLQNWHAVLTTEASKDDLHFEVTYNGNLKETYLNVYSKVSSTVIPNTGSSETTKLDPVLPNTKENR